LKIAPGADHGEFELKQDMAELLRDEGLDVIDLRNGVYDSSDDYPEFAISIAGAALGSTRLSIRQGVEDHDVNVLYFGSRQMGIVFVWDRILKFLGAKFTGADRHPRSLAK
jgi:ribose 5-phosphate isomerase B